jgi:hypothetical protein
VASMTLPVDASMRARRRLRTRQCGSKVRYLSQLLASNAAVLHAWAGRPGMAPYRCPWCDDWHIGHRPRRSGRR